MRKIEVCSCGAEFHTWSYRKLQLWRAEHPHEVKEELQVPPQGGTSQVELSADVMPYEDRAKIGFTAR